MATVFITGANRGIGLELAKCFSARGDQVYGTSRIPDAVPTDLFERVFSLDVCNQTSIDALARGLNGVQIDVLINSAGVLHLNTLESLDLESIRHQFEVNSLGPLRVTAALEGCLVEGSKVCVITSRMGSVTDNTSGGYYGYRMSKAAANMAGKSLAMDLGPRGIAVRILHPGFVKTGMTGFRGNWGPEAAAAAIVQRIDEMTLENTGEFRHAEGQELPW